MDPTNYIKYEDYEASCTNLTLIIGIVLILIGVLILYGAYTNRAGAMLIFGLIFGGVGVYLAINSDSVCKYRYDTAWAQMRMYGYDPNKPETYATAKSLYDFSQIRNNMYNNNNNLGFRTQGMTINL